jgi:hypothetical protein
MMTKRVLLPLFILLIFFSCRHRMEDINPETWRIRTMKTEYESITYTYKNGQLAQTNTEYLFKEPHAPLSTCQNWEIKDGELLRTMCSSNQNAGFYTKIGANGKVSEENAAYQYLEKSYDHKGFLIEVKAYSMGIPRQLYAITKYEIVNNNVVKEWRIEGGKEYLTTTYEYYEDKRNTISNENFGLTWAGRSSQNLVKKINTYDISQPIVTIMPTICEYDFDAGNRVIRGHEHNENGTYYSTTEYTYW